MAILLTGATGFVIANLARHLAEGGHEVIAADLNPPDPPLQRFLGGLRGAVRFRELDVTDGGAVARLLAEARPERLVHGAAITAIPPEVERARFLRTAAVNVAGTLEVLEAASAREALAALERARSEARTFHFAILDRFPPDLDGKELAARIKNELGVGSARLVLTTAPGRTEKPSTLVRAGFDAWIAKPINERKLRTALLHVAEDLSVLPRAAPPRPSRRRA